MNAFEPFIVSILTQAGFHPTEINKDLIDETMDIFVDRVITSLTEKLEDDDKVIFLELLENNEDNLNPGFEFVKMKIKDYEDTLEDIMDDFAKEYIEEFKKETL